MSKIVVIIPTYNEKDVICEVIDALEAEFSLIPNHQMSILVVDGNSPDGTASRVKEKSRECGNVNLIVEKDKRGLGAAHIVGMKYAIDFQKVDAFIEFDGDFQHDPKDIRRLIKEFDDGYDYVIGSRYINGGSIPSAWGWHRKLLSNMGGRVIKFLLKLPTHDNTSGFKLTRIHPFAEYLSLSSEKILSRRHAYKIHLLYEMIRAGAKVKEIPIKFLERRGGNSKSSVEDIVESLKVTLSLWFRDLM